MARPRRRARARREGVDCPRLRFHLMTGRDLPVLTGPGPAGDLSAEAWAVLGAGLTAAWSRGEARRADGAPPRGAPGTRPWGWWEYEAPGPRRPGEAEADYLRRHGLLGADEEAALAAAG